jgi:UDP-glucuronate 4-epimerase
MTLLVTGAAGFIGYHLCQALLSQGQKIIGLDNLNNYYDPSLKHARLSRLLPQQGFKFWQGDITDTQFIQTLFREETIHAVIHLAAQAGVRYSITHPRDYWQANLIGFGEILEACRHHDIQHLIYASSSSVYGANSSYPFTEHDLCDQPVSLYGATKKANELMAHSYATLYQVPCTGLRFFTVYGPYGRPDMAPFLFTQKIFRGETIDVFNHGQLTRDFTYIDDIIGGILTLIDLPPSPHRVFNIGRGEPVNLMDFIQCLEKTIGKPAKLRFCEMQAGDVFNTYASTMALNALTGYKPRISLHEGIERFVMWYREFYQLGEKIHAEQDSQPVF